MGLFDKFKKSTAAPEPVKAVEWPVAVFACTKGKVLNMNEIPDPVFSEGVLGQCCGIEPMEGKIYAPVDGKVTQVADSKHALGFVGPGEVEILNHVGVDTVDMNGDGFNPLVKVGDTVKVGQPVLTMDLDKIKAAGHPSTVITVVTNSDDFSSVELAGSGEVETGAELLKVSK
uniref:PTS sugar transporter subunit IIA n=1 Tax=Enterocloster clostridioformis TaxID=1531 RepID=UPI001C3CC4CD|nr:PTS glucose transporter subunit IIA [Enterocloster clostridioformis]